MPVTLAKWVLIVALANITACGQKKTGPNELVGDWLGRVVTTKLPGHADESKTYTAKELELRYSADGTFAIQDRGEPNETISISGTYEITNDRRLKETILEVTGSKIASDGLKGRTSIKDFNVSADRLTLIMHLVDKAGKNMGTTESTFVRAPK